MIRVDSFTRQNADVGIGERVKVRRAIAKDAQAVILAPLDGATVQLSGNSNATETIRHQISKRAIMQGDIIPLLYSMPNPILGRTPTNQDVQLVAVRVEPPGPVVITDTTTIELVEKPVHVSNVRSGIVKYTDIGGLADVKREIIETIEWSLKNPERFIEMGIRPPKSILLFGPSGTGKTQLVKAIANESGIEFFSISGPEILSRSPEESETRLKEVFENAKENAPAIIFIDELDSVAIRRDDVMGESERRVVSQMFSLMDLYVERGKVIVIGSTNRPDLIDPALLRPGRFDRLIYVEPPTRDGRLEILKIHSRKMPLAEDVDLLKLSGLTEGFVGSDIEGICREAVMLAFRDDPNAKQVEMKHFREALMKFKHNNEMRLNYSTGIHEKLAGQV
jgi:transitional endoplasmic reticulum ATPase